DSSRHRHGHTPGCRTPGDGTVGRRREPRVVSPTNDLEPVPCGLLGPRSIGTGAHEERRVLARQTVVVDEEIETARPLELCLERLLDRVQVVELTKRRPRATG